MKKVVCILLLVVMCAGVLAGCGGEADATKLPHNKEISITDKKKDILNKEELKTDDEITYTIEEPVKVGDKEYSVSYEFSNEEPDKDFIAGVRYNSKDVKLEDAQKFIDSAYGDLEKDITEGKYGPDQDGRYVIESDGKIWTVGCFTDDYKGGTVIIISRDKKLE